MTDNRYQSMDHGLYHSKSFHGVDDPTFLYARTISLATLEIRWIQHATQQDSGAPHPSGEKDDKHGNANHRDGRDAEN
jgi:hypothetical protein